ncbi:hypothetical protein [Longibacter sp.]|uniref:hypothetical protein n=1 Tax=Longibacter sp. TaxID=2045415 RepID=UPI003EBA4BDA
MNARHRSLLILTHAPSLRVAQIVADAGADGVICRRASLGPKGEPTGLTDWVDSLDTRLFVQLRRLHAGTALDVESAIEAGVTGITLPRTHSTGEADTVIRLVCRRVETLIRVDPACLLRDVRMLGTMGWDHLHIGLRKPDNAGSPNWTRSTPICTTAVTDFIASLPGRSAGFVDLPFRPGGTLSLSDLQDLQRMARAGGSLAILHAAPTLSPAIARTWIRTIRHAWSTEHPALTLSPAEPVYSPARTATS